MKATINFHLSKLIEIFPFLSLSFIRSSHEPCYQYTTGDETIKDVSVCFNVSVCAHVCVCLYVHVCECVLTRICAHICVLQVIFN